MNCRLLAGLTLISAALFSTQASAGLNVCNKSQADRIVLAYAYEDRDKGWATTGWLDIAKGQCVTIVQGPIMDRYHYVYAEEPAGGNGFHWGGDRQNSQVFFCTSSMKHFTIFNADVPNGCEAAGFSTKQFLKVDTGDLKNYERDLTGG